MPTLTNADAAEHAEALATMDALGGGTANFRVDRWVPGKDNGDRGTYIYYDALAADVNNASSEFPKKPCPTCGKVTVTSCGRCWVCYMDPSKEGR
jgi:hypothetical protein